jgi:hypothetical protein
MSEFNFKPEMVIHPETIGRKLLRDLNNMIVELFAPKGMRLQKKPDYGDASPSKKINAKGINPLSDAVDFYFKGSDPKVRVVGDERK